MAKACASPSRYLDISTSSEGLSTTTLPPVGPNYSPTTSHFKNHQQIQGIILANKLGSLLIFNAQEEKKFLPPEIIIKNWLCQYPYAPCRFSFRHETHSRRAQRSIDAGIVVTPRNTEGYDIVVSPRQCRASLRLLGPGFRDGN